MTTASPPCQTACPCPAAHLSGYSHYPVRSWLPGYNGHLLLDGLHIWRALWLCSVRESHHPLSILMLLLGPVLQPAPADALPASNFTWAGPFLIARQLVSEGQLRCGSVCPGQLWCTAPSACIPITPQSSRTHSARHSMVVWCSLRYMLYVHSLYALLAQLRPSPAM